MITASHPDVGEDAWLKGNANARDDLNHADDQHQIVRVDRRYAGHNRRHILIPVDKQVEKLVQAGEDRRYYKTDVKDAKCLISGRSGLVRGCV